MRGGQGATGFVATLSGGPARIACSVILSLLPFAGCAPPAARNALLSPEIEAKLQTIDSLPLEEPHRPAPVPDRASSPGATPVLPGDMRSIAASTVGLLAGPHGSGPWLAAGALMPGRPVVPEQAELPLDQARAAALGNNLDLQVALVNPLLARQSVGIEEGRFEATFAPAVSLTNYRPSPETAVTFPLPPQPAVIELFQPAVNLPLYTGGQVSAGEQIIRTNNLIPDAFPIYDSQMFLSITQPLLRNAGVGVTTAALQIAQLQTRSSDADTKLAAIRVLADVERAYWALVGARLEMEVRRQQVRLAAGQLANAERLVEAGVVSIADTSRAEFGLEQRREAVVVAETALRLRERDLKRIMLRPDLPVDSTRSILPVSIPNPGRLALDRDKLVEQAINNRMELFRLEVELAAEAIRVATTRCGRLPRVDLSARYSALGAGSTLNHALEQQFDLNYQEWIVGLQGEVFLGGNQSARARLQQAQLRQLQTAIAQQRLRVLITQEVYDAVDQVELGWERIVAARRAAEAAQRAYEAEVKQFERGLRTSTDVLIAAGFHADSQSRQISALVEYQNAKVALAVATGTMLGYGRVSWAPIPLHSDPAESGP